MTRPELVVDIECETGEGPLWHPDEELLYWTDIPNGRIYRYDPAADDHELVYEDGEERIGGFTFQTDGSLLLFQEWGAVRRLDQSSGTVDPVVEPDPERFHERFNDVIADPEGRVFAGVMPDPERDLPGQLYRLHTDGTFELIRECVLPNGMGFTGDRSQFYFTDTGEVDPDCPGYIYRYDYDRATGEISNVETFLDASGIEGLPDGMTVDSEDRVWSAFWDGNKLIRFAPDGTREATVEFDPRKVSSVTFAGDDYETAYVTTACVETRETEGEGAGSLYRLDLGVTGREEFRSAIEV
ncbi:SMP-30/gluconolactonase/LRE family protein [Haloarcula nitratireducens]|uniref:SMP-30/gluconolactonase/LRE family protein n=1 Tax=Haloarcula nitratireducens TaxID=2487749 RepID=A0AAW4PI19_9EURY|nr:SMP-30/gluconolactonase/LRE family protein [Halomicroarcula nitratireducens]MBX0297283.1 SMP-30/gluconolactonase/LRE family protein [Halomicroarcula nitratireducens]